MAQFSQVAEVLSLPQVRLEVRQGGRSTSYGLDHVDFLIGTVPGCDLRLPGSDLPPVICVLARHPAGLALRKLAPTQVVLLNGQTATHSELADGDRITLGALDVIVHVEAATAESNLEVSAGRQALQKQADQFRAQVVRLQEERQAFDAERAQWQTQLRKHAGSTNQPQLDERAADLDRQRQELAGQRQELADIRKQLYDRYQERRDRLSSLHASVDHAVKKVQERKRQLEEQVQEAQRHRQELEQRQAEHAERAQQSAALVAKLDEERRTFHASQHTMRVELDARSEDLQRREQQLATDRRTWEDRLRHYEADVLRLDRRQGELEKHEAALAERHRLIEEKLEKLQRDSGELEQQALQLDELKMQLEEQAQRLGRQQQEQEALGLQLHQRAASLEGQQATLAALRARMERVREDVQRQEQQLTEERGRQDKAAGQLEQESQALLLLKSELDNEQRLREQERLQLSQRQATVESAVANLRQAQEKAAEQEKELLERVQETQRREQALAELEGTLQGRLSQVSQTQERLDAERQALRERTLALTQAEQAREALQEQLRKRGEELAARHKEWQDKFATIDSQCADLEARRAELASAQEQARTEAAERQRTLTQQAALVQQQQAALTKLRDEVAQAETALERARQGFNQEQETARCRAQAQAEEQAKAQAEWVAMRRQSATLGQQLPDLELRAGAALDRLSHAREQLRDHLAEINAFVHQCQEDLDGQRAHLQTDLQQLRAQEQTVRHGQDEHRLALAAFRQQLIAWQGNIAELKRSLSRGETRLERKQAQVDQEARRLDEASVQLARQTEHLQEQHQAVAERRHEIDRHLVDMREWYRRKLRDLAGVDLAADGSSKSADDGPPTGRHILSLTEPMSPADRTLGELLRAHDLVDAETLTALLVEARRQRRSLRQVLLASGAVTLYQLALIEAGNLDGLMLGHVRVLDRLRATPHETVYRVFDPQRGHEAVLRHLSDADGDDAVRPDEFRQRFTSLLHADPHWASTLEVLEIGGRPAVLQEWLTGLPASDWTPLAAAPGVCYRLLTQIALGLAQAHQRGVVHGRLDESCLVLTADGVVKICGLGEPGWLAGLAQEAADPATDLAALGRLAAGWTPAGVRKGAKAKPVPDTLAAVLDRLTHGRYLSAQDLLADLDRAGADVPANAEAWDRLLKYVREHGAPEATLRQSA